ncbi:MAG TPA: arginine--tRNA ligase [Candidatus Saccharimonadales bacterium]
MDTDIQNLIAGAVNKLFNAKEQVELSIPEEQFGDLSTNVALKLAPMLNRPPRDIASEIIDYINQSPVDFIQSLDIAGVGFINISLTNEALLGLIDVLPAKNLDDQVIVADYSDPNPFKILHAGHLYTSIVGDVIANLLERAGAEVHRVNFGGDVGLHVAKNIWAIISSFGGQEDPSRLDEIEESKRSEWLSKCYVEGNTAYESSDEAKEQIKSLNARIYELSASQDHDSPLAQIYWTCRQWSYDYFNSFYNRLNIGFEKYYPESEVVELGLQTVRENIPKVYQESQGAIIFDGEKYGLYTNVFINSEGLPTYAAKDVGLIIRKWQDYKFDQSLIITSNEQLGYMKVVIKSVEQFRPDLAAASTHLSHGVVKLAGGQKMSSRLGNILLATDVLDAAADANSQNHVDDEQVTIGAVKYSFLKQRIGGDIVYEPKESVSIEGNSGPYLQYAHARARNILNKVDNIQEPSDVAVLTKEERSLVRKIGEYAAVIDQATEELKPHYVCTYLYELAQIFNRFYENNRVIGDEKQNFRLKLVGRYADRLAAGLSILGIASPEKM